MEETTWLVIAILLTVVGGFGLFRQVSYLFGEDFYEVKEDINDSCGGCFFISGYMFAALLTPTLYLVVGVYALILVISGASSTPDADVEGDASDFSKARLYLILSIVWTLCYCCIIAPFSSCLFSCCFMDEEEGELEEGKKVKSERVAAFTGGMQKTMFDPQSEYFAKLGKSFHRGNRAAPEEE